MRKKNWIKGIPIPHKNVLMLSRDSNVTDVEKLYSTFCNNNNKTKIVFRNDLKIYRIEVRMIMTMASRFLLKEINIKLMINLASSVITLQIKIKIITDDEYILFAKIQ